MPKCTKPISRCSRIGDGNLLTDTDFVQIAIAVLRLFSNSLDRVLETNTETTLGFLCISSVFRQAKQGKFYPTAALELLDTAPVMLGDAERAISQNNVT